MKLLYVWIEHFRNIHCQEIVVDNEYFIRVTDHVAKPPNYYTNEGQLISFKGDTPHSARKIFTRSIEFVKNPHYIKSTIPITSITALVGENASGKSSILECLYTPNRFTHNNKEDRQFFFAFLNEDDNSLVVRTADVWLTGENGRKQDLRHLSGYEEYIFQPDNYLPQQKEDITHLFSYSLRKNTRANDFVMGMRSLSADLSFFDARNSFEGAFDFLCSFPKLGGMDNKLTVYLSDKEDRQDDSYFTYGMLTSEDYKCYFINKLAKALFGRLRDYLFHPQPEVMCDGSVLKHSYDETLFVEDEECMNILAFGPHEYPKPNSTSIYSYNKIDIPRAEIREALNFFKTSTFIYGAKNYFIQYIESLEQLFLALFDLENQLFTALYKIEIPFDPQYKYLVHALQYSLSFDDQENHWTKCLHIGFEWFSAGEYHIAMLFSAIYQRINKQYTGFHGRHVILIIDEPEMHMHPEAGRSFIDNLERSLELFKNNGLLKTCQLIFATHSPFIIQNLSNYKHSLSLVSKEHNYININQFNDLPQLKLRPRQSLYSFNLVMYHVFHISTVELHIELYGYLQEKTNKSSVTACDKYILNNPLYVRLLHEKRDTYTNDFNKTYYYWTLPTYIRNAIDHPDPNKTYSPQEFECSIKLLIALCQ